MSVFSFFYSFYCAVVAVHGTRMRRETRIYPHTDTNKFIIIIIIYNCYKPKYDILLDFMNAWPTKQPSTTALGTFTWKSCKRTAHTHTHTLTHSQRMHASRPSWHMCEYIYMRRVLLVVCSQSLSLSHVPIIFFFFSSFHCFILRLLLLPVIVLYSGFLLAPLLLLLALMVAASFIKFAFFCDSFISLIQFLIPMLRISTCASFFFQPNTNTHTHTHLQMPTLAFSLIARTS